jgi:hypothetical protein
MHPVPTETGIKPPGKFILYRLFRSLTWLWGGHNFSYRYWWWLLLLLSLLLLTRHAHALVERGGHLGAVQCHRFKNLQGQERERERREIGGREREGKREKEKRKKNGVRLLHGKSLKSKD